MLVRVTMLHIFMLAILLVVPSVCVVIRAYQDHVRHGEASDLWRRKQFPTIAQTKKYDFADSIAVYIVSPLMIRRSRMLVASRERNEGKWEEVMLKDIAGVTQAGNLNNFVEAKPKASDSNV